MAEAKAYKDKINAISKQMNQIHQRTKNLKVVLLINRFSIN